MGEDLKSIIGKNLKTLRREKGFSLSVLKNKSGVGVSTICDYESGNYLPGVGNLVALAEALGATPNDILGYESLESTTLLSPNEKYFLRGFLREEERKYLEALRDYLNSDQEAKDVAELVTELGK